MPDHEELRSVVAAALDVDTSELTDDADFVVDLGVDSLLALEVIVVLEKEYSVKFGEDELKSVTTLSKVHRLLSTKLQGA